MITALITKEVGNGKVSFYKKFISLESLGIFIRNCIKEAKTRDFVRHYVTCDKEVVFVIESKNEVTSIVLTMSLEVFASLLQEQLL